jgi:hypothetical protein
LATHPDGKAIRALAMSMPLEITGTPVAAILSYAGSSPQSRWTS